jgi:hypothetical protein
MNRKTVQVEIQDSILKHLVEDQIAAHPGFGVFCCG